MVCPFGGGYGLQASFNDLNGTNKSNHFNQNVNNSATGKIFNINEMPVERSLVMFNNIRATHPVNNMTHQYFALYLTSCY